MTVLPDWILLAFIPLFRTFWFSCQASCIIWQNVGLIWVMFSKKCLKAPVMEFGLNLSPVAKNINSTEHFMNLNEVTTLSSNSKVDNKWIMYLYQDAVFCKGGLLQALLNPFIPSGYGKGIKLCPHLCSIQMLHLHRQSKVDRMLNIVFN